MDGADAEALTFEVAFGRVGASFGSDDVSDGPTITLPDAFLSRPSTWTATVIHPDDVNSRNNTKAGKVLNPCRPPAS